MVYSDKLAREHTLLQQGLGATEAFASWPADAIQKLLPAARLVRYQRGALVQRKGIGESEVLVVLSGHLMMSRPVADGSNAAMALVGPGALVGVPQGRESLDEMACDYLAHDPAVVVHLLTRAVLEILDAKPSLWRSMALMLLKQQRQLLVTLMHHLSGPLRQRLAATLGRLAQLHGVRDDAHSLRLCLSQEDLAAMLQTTRQSINRELRAFEALGLVSAKYGAVVVYDLASLRALGSAPGT